MIDSFGGVGNFYSRFLISSVSPLGFTSVNSAEKVVNYNYYDSKELIETVYDFIIDSLRKQLDFGIERDVCFCLGTGKNYKFFVKLNENLNLFRQIIPMEHPRYIMQYRSKQKHIYIKKYVEAFSMV
jgi:hypothetical protein